MSDAWRTPNLVEIRLSWRQLHYIGLITKWHGPENDQWHILTLPDDVILAALSAPSRAALAPCSKGAWFQLTEHDRRALRAVFFHDGLDAALKGKDQRNSSINWVRWLAVREAHSCEKLSWPKARKTASERLAGTPAAGEPATMKWSYELVQRILRSTDIGLIGGLSH